MPSYNFLVSYQIFDTIQKEKRLKVCNDIITIYQPEGSKPNMIQGLFNGIKNHITASNGLTGSPAFLELYHLQQVSFDPENNNEN